MIKRETKRRQERGVKRRDVTYESVIAGEGGIRWLTRKARKDLVFVGRPFLGKDVFVKPSSIGKSNGADRA